MEDYREPNSNHKLYQGLTVEGGGRVRRRALIVGKGQLLLKSGGKHRKWVRNRAGSGSQHDCKRGCNG